MTLDTIYTMTQTGTKLVCPGREQDVAANISLITVGDRQKMINDCKSVIAKCQQQIKEQQNKKKNSQNPAEVINCNDIIAKCKKIIKNNERMIAERTAEVENLRKPNKKLQEFYTEQERIKAVLATTGKQKGK